MVLFAGLAVQRRLQCRASEPAAPTFMQTQLFRTKSLDAILSDGEASEHRLSRALTAFDVVMLGIGAIVGAGIFATIGTAAAGDATRPGAGPALVLSFVFTAI